MANESGVPPTIRADGLINSPQLTPSGKRTVRSVKDVDQAKRVIRAMIEHNRYRMVINGRIMAKYNAERPYQQKELESEGLGWRSNFTTKPLPQMIEKVAPRFVEAIAGQKYLTNASLPATTEGATAKTELFRKEITKTIRSRKGWRVLVEDIAMEDGLFGFTCCACLDEFTWFPKHFRQDEFFLPVGTKQLVGSTQVAVLKETYLPHELFEYVEDKDSAETLGWNIKNTITAINNAAPSNVKSQLSDWQRIYQDMHRELSPGHSFELGARVITVYSLLAVEVDGKVSHYRLAGDDLAEVFSKDDRFESIDSCLAFFSFQKGNGTMHGSKGVGREIYELAGIIDRCRNEVVDRLNLSGKCFIQAGPQQLKKFKMSVVGNSILIEDGFKITEQKIDGNVDDFLKLDNYLSVIVDRLIGSVSPPSPAAQGEAFRSKAAWDLMAAREEEGKDTRITRFVEQFTDMMGTMQKRLCDPETIEKDAKEMQARLLKSMTREELNMLANQPVAGTVADLTPNQRQQLVMIATENRGNVLYNQRALEVEKITAQVDGEFADKVLLPENDPTEQAEQLRFQQMEVALLSAGHPVPVSPRDNHKIHLSVVMPLLEQAASGVNEGSTGTNSLEAMAAHAQEHIQTALQHGAMEKDFSQETALLKKLLPVIQQLKQIDQQAEQLSVAHADNLGLTPGGAPPQPGEAAALPQPQ